MLLFLFGAQNNTSDSYGFCRYSLGFIPDSSKILPEITCCLLQPGSQNFTFAK